LNNEILPLVAELGEFGRDVVKSGILAGLETFVGLGISIIIAGCVLEFTSLSSGFLPILRDPAISPRTIKGLLEMDCRGSNRQHINETHLK